MSKQLTKEILVMNYGITFVSEDGKHILKGPKEISQHTAGGYLKINVRDVAEYQATPKEERNKHTACYKVSVHRIVYAWFNGEVPANMVVDHKDTDKTNNALSNLQLLTQDENMAKYSVDLQNTLIECDLDQPREYYEEQLEYYTREAKKLRAKLRYYDAKNRKE